MSEPVLRCGDLGLAVLCCPACRGIEGPLPSPEEEPDPSHGRHFLPEQHEDSDADDPDLLDEAALATACVGWVVLPDQRKAALCCQQAYAVRQWGWA